MLLVETLHLFPMITLNVVDALGKIDPALEEAAESVGARGWTKLRTITLPLTTPGYVAGALLVFIWTFSDFATPLVLGVHDLLAAQAYLNIVQFVDRRLFRMGIVISALMVGARGRVPGRRPPLRGDQGLLVAVVLARGAPAAVAGRPGRGRRLPVAGDAASFIPYLGVGLASVGKGWSLTPFPLQYTLQYFERVIVETPKYIVNSFLYSALAGPPASWSACPSRGSSRARACPAATRSTASTR